MWISTFTPPYAFITALLFKHKNDFAFFFYLYEPKFKSFLNFHCLPSPIKYSIKIRSVRPTFGYETRGWTEACMRYLTEEFVAATNKKKIIKVGISAGTPAIQIEVFAVFLSRLRKMSDSASITSRPILSKILCNTSFINHLTIRRCII
jgi:hypothetical protein